MHNATKLFIAAALLCAAAWSSASSEDGMDCEGCSDHALLARYPGSTLLGADQQAYDEAIFPTGPAAKSDTGETLPPKTLSVTGKRTRLFYIAPAGRSGFEVFANYREALEKGGMKLLWTCSTDQTCGPDFINQALGLMNIDLTNTIEARLGLVLAEHPRYLLATLARPQGDVHVAVMAADISDKQRPGIYVLQVEGKPMDKGMAGTRQGTPVETPPTVIESPVPAAVQSKPVVVESTQAPVESRPVAVESKPVAVESKPVVVESAPAVIESKPAEQPVIPVAAAAMDSHLADTGKVILYGIHFDFDKSDIKPESKPQIDEVAKVLTANPALKLRVTGYTDGKGSAEHNQALSRRRADAIVAALVANYAITANRLTSAGLGASEPVASNDTEEGRAKNRRVELLKQ